MDEAVVPAVVRRVPAVVRRVRAVVRRVLAVVRRVLAVVRRVLAAVCWVQQLSHEDQKHHKGKTRNFYLKFLLSFPLFFLLSLIPVLFYFVFTRFRGGEGKRV
jgi:hypothetical protein